MAIREIQRSSWPSEVPALLERVPAGTTCGSQVFAKNPHAPFMHISKVGPEKQVIKKGFPSGTLFPSAWVDIQHFGKDPSPWVWCGQVRDKVLQFGEDNNGRHWLSKEEILFLYLIYHTNESYYNISPFTMEKVWPSTAFYMSCPDPITPDSCLKGTPKGNGTYEWEVLY
jgi:hypothetical protein